MQPTDHLILILKNTPYETWSIHEYWTLGKIRTPFTSQQEAIEREIEIAKAEGWEGTLIIILKWREIQL